MAIYLIPAVVFGQGIVAFRNDVLPSPPDRLIRNIDESPLVGTNFVAQLYYGSNVWSLQAVGRPPAPFRTPLTSSPGTWQGGNRTLVGFAAGSVLTMAVKVWDSVHGSTPEEAARNGAFAMGVSPFTYMLPPPNADPTNYYMYNFKSCSPLACCDCARGPRFDRQPQSHTVAAGSDVILSADAIGACFGEWRFNGTNLLGPGRWTFGYSNQLILSNVQLSHSGNYQLLLGSYGGFVTSEVAILTVVVRPQLATVAHTGNEFRFYVPGDGERSFAVETTTNLSGSTTWLPVQTNTAPFWFTNSVPDLDRQRFYRAVAR